MASGKAGCTYRAGSVVVPGKEKRRRGAGRGVAVTAVPGRPPPTGPIGACAHSTHCLSMPLRGPFNAAPARRPAPPRPAPPCPPLSRRLLVHVYCARPHRRAVCTVLYVRDTILTACGYPLSRTVTLPPPTTPPIPHRGGRGMIPVPTLPPLCLLCPPSPAQPPFRPIHGKHAHPLPAAACRRRDGRALGG